MASLTKSQRDYIEDNIGKKSLRHIAKELKLDKRSVYKYIKGFKKTDTIPYKHKSPSFIKKIIIKIPEKQRMIIQIIFVFAIALLVRLIYIYQLNHTYFFKPFKGGFDDYVFDNWAQEILKGNWLGDRDIYIYRMPLYAYFLSFIYFIFGHSYWAVYILQAVIGAITCVLIYFIGKPLFSRSVGLIASLMAALYSSFVFYTGMLVGETLGLFLICLAFIFLLAFQKTQKLYHLFLGGLTLGLSMLLRANILILLPLVFLWLYMLLKKRSITFKILSVSIFILAIAIAILPIILRNYIIEKDLVPIAASGGLNVYIGNAYGADGRFRAVEKIGTNLEDMLKNSVKIAEADVGKKLKPSAISNYWLKETLRSINSHGITYIFPLVIKKFVMFWNSYELPDIWDYYFFKLYIPVLNFPLFSFFIIAPLAFIGLYLSWPRRLEISLIYIFIFGYIASLLIIFITSRYKSQIVPLLILLAAYSIVQLKGLIAENKSKIGICAVILVLGIIFSNLPIQKIDFETSFNSLGILLKRAGRTEEAIATYKKAIEMAPAYPTPYYNLGLLYRDNGQVDLAKFYFTKALEIAPDFIEAKQKLEELSP